MVQFRWSGIRFIVVSFCLAAFVVLPVALAVGNPDAPPEGPSQWIVVQQVNDDHAVYVPYQRQQSQRYDLTDLILSKDIVGKGDPFNLHYTDISHFKLRLLENGLAQLRTPDSAPAELRVAQEKARSNRRGMWAATGQPLGIDWEKLFSAILSVLLILGTLGILGFLVRLFFRRRLRLLIIGEQSVGKTALYIRLLDPNVEKKKILELTGSRSKKEVIRTNCIRRGRYEIFPCLVDVPGIAHGLVWDELARGRWPVLSPIMATFRPRAIIFVIASARVNSANGSDVAVDEKYVHVQLGLTKAYLEGLLSSTRLAKPKGVVLFVNKFDLVSKFPPGDSSSTEATMKLEGVFDDHIKGVTLAAKQIQIPFHVIFGSALEGWNCERLLDMIGSDLYGY